MFCSSGVRFTTFHGHFMLRTTDLLALPAVDCDKAFAMQLSLEDTLMTSQTVYFQVALLYLLLNSITMSLIFGSYRLIFLLYEERRRRCGRVWFGEHLNS